MVSPKSLENLKKRKRFGLEQPVRPGPGRPKEITLPEVISAIRSDCKRRGQAAIERLYNERIDLYWSYGFGRPTEKVEIDAKVTGAIQLETIVQAAIAIRTEIDKPVIQPVVAQVEQPTPQEQPALEAPKTDSSQDVANEQPS